MTKSYKITLETNPETGDLVAPLPEEMMKDCDWRVGDDIGFDMCEDAVIITNYSWLARRKLDSHNA